MPILKFVFSGGVEILLHPSSYMDNTQNEFGLWTSRLYIEEPSGAILGASAFMYREIIFDEESQRLGFREAGHDCTVV